MSHPEPEALAAYHAGELTEPEERRLQDHLVGCPECAALLLDLDGLSDPSFGAGSLAPAEQEALWRSLRAEIRREEPAPLAPVIPLRRPIATPRWLPALAAALLAVTIGLSAWVVSLRRTVDALSRPQPNAPVIQLSPLTTRGRGSREEIRADDPRLFTLVLYLPGPASRATRYRAEILRHDGSKVLEVPGLAFKEDLDGVSLGLSRDEIGPGDYRLRLLGSTGRGAPEKLVAEYPLHVEPRRGKP